MRSILALLFLTACVADETSTDTSAVDGPTVCLPSQTLNFPDIGPLSNLKTFCDGGLPMYPCSMSPNGNVPNCWAGVIVTAHTATGTTPAQCLCENLPPPGPGCNPVLGGPANAGGGVQDCRKPQAVQFTIREKQAIGPKDMSGSRYDADSCIADWIKFLRGPNGKGNWSILECSTAATTACAGGELTTWADDRLVPFTAQDRHRMQMDVSLSCSNVPEGGTPRMIGSQIPNTGGAGTSGQELCGLVNGQSYGSQAWAVGGSWRLNLRGEPPGLIGAGFNLACATCGKSPFGGILDRCSNSSIMMDYAGSFSCRNGSPTITVSHGTVTVFPSSRFEVVATPITETGAATGAASSTVFVSEHIMQRPMGAAGLVIWNPPRGQPKPDGATKNLIAGPIPMNPQCRVP